jgi:putative DNA primase/helicase
MNLHPLHLQDLSKSGLTDETIELAGIDTVLPKNIEKETGCHDNNLFSAYRIPYGNGFNRFRCFYLEGSTGAKYRQKKGTGNHLYIPANFNRDILQDTTKPIFITEGEKKALRACQSGIPCIGLSGLWNWKNSGSYELIDDFNSIVLEGRTVKIIPDDDWKQPNIHGYKTNLEKAVYGLAGKLKERGARVFIVNLETKRK